MLAPALAPSGPARRSGIRPNAFRRVKRSNVIGFDARKRSVPNTLTNSICLLLMTPRFMLVFACLGLTVLVTMKEYKDHVEGILFYLVSWKPFF